MARFISRSYSQSPELFLPFEVMKFPKISGYWLVTGALTVSGAAFAWYNGESIDPSPYKRVMYVFAIGAFAIVARAKFTGGWRQAVRIAPRDGAKKHERDASARAKSTASTDADVGSSRRGKLETALRDRHGSRWRYRDRWIAIVGDEKVVERMVPGLLVNGFVVSDSTVLLYARQSGDSLDTSWLEQIREMRRGRPVDAMVAIEQSTAQSGAQFSGAQLNAQSTSPFDGQTIAQKLARHARALRWAAPAYVLNVLDLGSNALTSSEIVGDTWGEARVNQVQLSGSLQALAARLADAGVARLAGNARDRFIGELSCHVGSLRNMLAELVAQAGESRLARCSVHGLLFAPLPVGKTPEELVRHADVKTSVIGQRAQHPVWQTIADHSRKLHGRRVGFSLSTAAAWIVSGVIALWLIGTVISGMSNRSAMQEAATTLTKLASVQDPTQALLALDALDKQIDTLEIHRREGAPWLARFGLNHDAALMDALQPAYQQAAARVLIAPIQAKLEARLNQLASLSDAEIASGGNAQVQAAYDTLKTYLMLAHPEHADAAFLSTQLLATNAPERPVNASVTPGTWEDVRQHAIAFYASHFKAPAITPDVSLVASTRQTIIGVRGIQNSTDAIYQQIIDEAKPKYPPVTLATLLGDHPSRGLFNTTATVPGVFTRAAWDERIPKAIDEASEQRTVTGDWVLSDAKIDNTAPSTLKAELRQRYFDDYARAWGQFLNSMRWQNASSLSGTVDQLTLLADPQRSPLVALMNAIVYQASAGAPTQSLSDNLIAKAQQWAGKNEKDPSKQTQPELAPLAAAFGPILRLTGSDLATNTPANPKSTPQPVGDLSLPRYLERVTAMRLKTQQMMAGADPDAMSRLAAQAMLQGKTSDIADSRDYASRLAASLGEQWSGFGHLFEAPLDQTWQVVVQPASSSLNDIWRTSIVADWNRTFGGRYPFSDADNDASLPDMARFMRLDNGIIAKFVATQLAGVIELQGDRWVAAQGTNQGTLTLDPAFLAALNKLTHVSTVLFPSGDARVRFELRGVPTPGITDMKLISSGQQLHYFNQMEQWIPFEWPGQALENQAQLQWQTDEGGLRSTMYAQGRFALIRLLERAKVEQQDNARYVLTWTPEASLNPPLSVELRAEGGAGPLDILQLRHFTLPTRIFVTSTAKDGAKYAGPNPPPLPSGAITAAQKVGVPLPGAH
jgi:type VI secretion system protein ImpL